MFITALKEAVDLPIQLHTHYTSGVASMTYLKAVEAGVDVIDTAMFRLRLESQPATEVMQEPSAELLMIPGWIRNLQRLQITSVDPRRSVDSGLLNPKNLE